MFSRLNPEPDCIVPNLFLSGYNIAQEKELLLKNNIKSILVIGSELKALYPKVTAI
jgi:hypothetical protein